MAKNGVPALAEFSRSDVVSGLLYLVIFPSWLSYLLWNKGIQAIGATRGEIFSPYYSAQRRVVQRAVSERAITLVPFGQRAADCLRNCIVLGKESRQNGEGGCVVSDMRRPKVVTAWW